MDTLIGSTAVDVERIPVGEVIDLMIDSLDGRLVYVVIEVGATLGFGGERYAVPWSAVDQEDDVLTLRCTHAHLVGAPIVEREFWPGMTADERWARAVDRHFDAVPCR